MNAPPPKPHVATCKGKKRHADELTARAAAMSHLAKGRGDVPTLYVYKCAVCSGWHLTKNRQGAAVTAHDPIKWRK